MATYIFFVVTVLPYLCKKAKRINHQEIRYCSMHHLLDSDGLIYDCIKHGGELCLV